MVNNRQRAGSRSNAQAGSGFEAAAQGYFRAQGVTLERSYSIRIGVTDGNKKERKFDLGSANPPVLVECKSHTWTGSGNVPSAKISVWNEAMYYFHIAPTEYRKILFVRRDYSAERGETLAAYYSRSYGHLIPEGVEIWEFDEQERTAARCEIPGQKVRPEIMAHFRASVERNRRLGELLAQ